MRSLTLVALVIASTLVLAQDTQYRVLKTHTLGGDGAWDYVVPDPPSHRVYVARQNRLMVVDEESGKLVGEVTGVNGAHGVAIVADANRGYATAGNDAAILAFDLKSLAVVGKVPAAEDADAIIYDPASHRVFSFNGDAHSSTVVDGKTGTLVTNIPLGGKPEYGVSAGDGHVYANLTDTGEVVDIDAARAVVQRRWPTAPCGNPVSMAIDVANARLFSGCRSGVMAVSDLRTGKVITTVPIGMGVDGTGYDPGSHDVFTSNADGTLTVIHQDSPDKYHVLQTLMTPVGSRNLGVDPLRHRVYVASAMFGPAPAGGRGRGPVLPGSFALLEIGK